MYFNALSIICLISPLESFSCYKDYNYYPLASLSNLGFSFSSALVVFSGLLCITNALFQLCVEIV